MAKKTVIAEDVEATDNVTAILAVPDVTITDLGAPETEPRELTVPLSAVSESILPWFEGCMKKATVPLDALQNRLNAGTPTADLEDFLGIAISVN